MIGGVDTHRDSHTAAALDAAGKRLGVEVFLADAAGYAALCARFESLGTVERIGIEGTGSYGAGLGRWLTRHGHSVVEVNCHGGQLWRRCGKSDPVDAEAAARSVLAGPALGTPKSQDQPVELIRVLRLQRRSAIKAHTQAANQLHGVLATAPDKVRERLAQLSLERLVAAALKLRVADVTASATSATLLVLRDLARRYRNLDREITELDQHLQAAVKSTAPEMLSRSGIGTELAGGLLVAAGDNPERLRTEAFFAALRGVSPVDASSARQRRHSLNRGGNRDANRALRVIAFVRMRGDQRTTAYVQRRTDQGLSKPEVLRCLKRSSVA